MYYLKSLINGVLILTFINFYIFVIIGYTIVDCVINSSEGEHLRENFACWSTNSSLQTGLYQTSNVSLLIQRSPISHSFFLSSAKKLPIEVEW